MLKSLQLYSFLFLSCVLCFATGSSGTQTGNSGSIEGAVKDPSGATVAGAIVEITNPVSGYTRKVSTGADGTFRFPNVPFNPYHMVVTADGFAGYTQDVDVRSTVPSVAQITLQLSAAASTSVMVEANGGDLVENDSTSHTDVDRGLIDRLPLESSSSSLSSLVTLSVPGVAADSNGQMHGLGDHASNSISLDGQPITDQTSKVFSNQIPEDSIQSLEVISGAPPAEFGDKTSLVIKVTTRSGLGVSPPHGQITTSYGSFGTSNAGFDLAYGSQKWGNFIAANGLDTGRFLDGPEIGVQHDKGNQENIFDRIDYQISQKDSVHLNLGYTRSWFQTPNSYDAENTTGWGFLSATPICPAGQIGSCGGLGPNGEPVGPQDQRSKIGTLNIAPTWTRLINNNTVLTAGAFVRRDQYNYYPSNNPFADYTPDLQLETVGQNRSLTNAGALANISYVKGINNWKVGINYEHTFLTENDQFGIVDPAANAVCLNLADLSPDTNPEVTNPAQCTGTLVANTGQGAVPAFSPLLGCYDLTRTAALPLSDGCPTGQSTSGIYNFHGHTDVKELSLYVQDTITLKNWSFNVGLRGDVYNGLTSAGQAEPRLGVAYNIKKTGTVLRASYARTMETPFNENLILASVGCNDPVIFELQENVAGGQCPQGAGSTATPLSPGHRNEFHAGIEQAFGKYLVIDSEYIWKYTHKAFDFSVLGNTPITYPIEWESSKIPGYAIRATVPDFHGFTAYVVMSSVAARFFEPQVSGIGATPTGSGVFRIDHDEKFNETTHVQYQPWKAGPWVGLNWRYDSGLVAGAVPFGDGSNPVDVSGLTPDQQYEAGLYCGAVFATPTTGISPNGLCPASLYGSKYLSIPAAGTENDDLNPPRIAPRNLFDVAVGEDNLFHGDRYKWSLRLTAINVTDKVALYNFLSTFSGTHYVTPRAMTAELGFHF